MTDKLPRVVGLEDLLRLKKPLRESPGPLVYFSNKEFNRALEGAVELKRLPKDAAPLATFASWPGGGVGQTQCTQLTGQICWGQWAPVPGTGQGITFGCRCTAVGDEVIPKLPKPACQLVLDSAGAFSCSGKCETGACRLGYFRNPLTREVTLQCACPLGLRPSRTITQP